MTISYRTRTRLRRFFSVVTVLAVVALLIWFGWLIWLDRFIVYQRDWGAKLDFTLSADFPEGVPATPPASKPPVEILYPDTNTQRPTDPVAETGIRGYYLDFNALKADISAVQQQLQQLPAGTAVLVDVKNPKGFFHYSTAVGEKISGEVDTARFDSLIEYLTDGKFHVIARLPAFRDRYFGLNNIPSGISYEGGGGALWLDKGGCFWLNPTKDKPLSYLISITKELKNMGFDEVVFTDFCLPDGKNIIFKDDPVEAITNAAATLVEACAADDFYVSFTGDATFPLPQGNSRLYLENVPAGDIQTVIEQIGVDNPAVRVLFYATGHDTRYDEYSVLRPLDFAQ